jgi:mannose-6-phosphate isomerase
LEQLYGKALPPGKIIGESWEIVDRDGESSLVANGALAGTTLRSLMEERRSELLGDAKDLDGRFPLLIKILDARETLSMQVHPPAGKARELGGEAKTELWYVADAAPGAEIFAGLKRGVTRDEFERRLREGRVEECVHRIPARPGDAMFLPSGRVHALGAGCVIFEAQQNSDTTYRVFDWNRVDAGGRSRELHLEKSLASIDFEDFEPALLEQTPRAREGRRVRPLVDDPLFQVELVDLAAGEKTSLAAAGSRITGVVSGAVRVEFDGGSWDATAGTFFLTPAAATGATVVATEPARLLDIFPGKG